MITMSNKPKLIVIAGLQTVQDMRKLYQCFPISGTLSHLLTWSHYYEILKADNPSHAKPHCPRQNTTKKIFLKK
jgi:hypothetical protein